MGTSVQLPFLAEGIEGGDVVTILVKPGDMVTEGQSIIELETDKATVPVPSSAAGKIVKILVKSGDKIKVGQALIELDGAGGTATSAPAPAATKAAPAPATKSEPIAPPTPLTAKPAPEPQVAPIAPAMDAIEPSAPEPAPVAAPTVAAPVQPVSETADESSLPAAPAVRRLARELGVNLRQVKGSETGGRITLEDVKAFVRERANGLTQPAGAKQAGPPVSKTGQVFQTLYGYERREALPSIRRKIAANMANAWSTIPHVHQFHDADITELIDLQKRYSPKFKEKGTSLTLTSLILKAVTHALKTFPQFNASIDLVNGNIIYKDYYNIGVAVDTPAGLIVPVIHNVDKKELLEISLELADIAKRTREKQVKLEELRGATFTVSNLGGVGGGPFTPIINPPEVAILGVGRGKTMPAYNKEGQVVPRTYMPLCVAYDHRLIDGADGARFAAEIAKILEDYEAMFLGL